MNRAKDVEPALMSGSTKLHRVFDGGSGRRQRITVFIAAFCSIRHSPVVDR